MAQAKRNFTRASLNSGATTQRRREPKTISAAPKHNAYVAINADKPVHPRMGELLPFLEERVSLRMPSDVKFLDGVLEYLNERMLRLGFVMPGDCDLIIALDEAIVNAVKHGNKCDPCKSVSITAEFTAEGTRFTIADEGHGFDVSSIPNPTEPCRLLEPNGRGLFLINHIMDEVAFNEAGNRVVMFKRIAREK
jgi:serine/threonine-protein kinase RsbW